jgi:hypothetical protein
MNIERTLLFRAIVMVTLISSCIYLTYGKDSPSIVYIVRNVAWNDFNSPDRVCTVRISQKSCDLGKLAANDVVQAEEPLIDSWAAPGLRVRG